MTAAVEGLSILCKAIQKELDHALTSTGTTSHPLWSPSREDSSSLSPAPSEPLDPDKGDDIQHINYLRSSINSQPIPPSTRELRNRTSGLLHPVGSPTSRLKHSTSAKATTSKASIPETTQVSPTLKQRLTTKSPYFKPPSTPKTKISCIPFPPTTSSSFGLVQEHLAHDPFRLLIAVIFLNKTRGAVALPVFYELMQRYPTPTDLAAAEHKDVVEIIQHLGLQNQRAKKCIALAKAWCERPPEKGKRYRLLHYPNRGDGKDVKPDEILDESDERVAWEVGQLPGIGAYAIDSWRIFCRDELRGLPHGLPETLNDQNKEEEMQKEWARVVPLDKELRAYLRWRWLRCGWVWDPITGERRPATEEEMEVTKKGGVVIEGEDGDGGAKVVREKPQEMEETEGREIVMGSTDESNIVVTKDSSALIEDDAAVFVPPVTPAAADGIDDDPKETQIEKSTPVMNAEYPP